MTSFELYEKLQPTTTDVVHTQLLSGGLYANMCNFYTKLIRDAARCNSYSSDVIFSINHIDNMLKEGFRPNEPFEPIWIGFRRRGVDGTSFVLSRCNGDRAEINKNYFALYSVTVEKEEEGWYNVLINEYWT